MKHACLFLVALSLFGCTAAVSDLNGLNNYSDACDPRGTPTPGGDLEIQFLNLVPHVNQDMFFALEVGDRQIESMFVLSTLDDASLDLVIPEIMPRAPATLAFWADTINPGTFDPIVEGGSAVDHQWTRPICPNGHMTFTHTTPFQDVQDAATLGAAFRFNLPTEIQRHELFDTFMMAAWAVQVDDLGRQTRAYYRWAPYVSPLPGMPVPAQRTPPTRFQVGGNALGEQRGPIDNGQFYDINFVIDVDEDGELGTPGDYICLWQNQAMPSTAPDPNFWEYVPDLRACDPPDGFDPATFVP